MANSIISTVEQLNRYQAIIADIFKKHYKSGSSTVEFPRDELVSITQSLNIKVPKNIGDIVYSFRYRNELPQSIRATAKNGYEWIIKGKGPALYEFKQVKIGRIIPRAELITVKIPDATPEIISTYAQSDEQALLAKVRYNRLVDIFLGITAYSLQNHLRTTVKNIGQIEIDEVYVGLDKYGRQFVVPVQAKGGKDKHGIVQTQQDIACCNEKYPQLLCRPISAQFMEDNKIAMFELTAAGDEIKVVDERHYQLVPSDKITAADLKSYCSRPI